MKFYIKGMSERRSKIYSDITSASKQIDLHIIRLMLYPDNKFQDHWMHEIWSFLYDVDKLKGSNKYPSEKFICYALATHNDIIDNYIEVVKDLEDTYSPVNVESTKILSVIIQYQCWLAKQLSSKGVVLQKDVKQVLMKLIERGNI